MVVLVRSVNKTMLLIDTAGPAKRSKSADTVYFIYGPGIKKVLLPVYTASLLG